MSSGAKQPRAEEEVRPPRSVIASRSGRKVVLYGHLDYNHDTASQEKWSYGEVKSRA